MDLIDRYLAAVRRHLPADSQADIIGELADSLRSEEEEQQAAAGRPLTETELAALLKRRGHPWLLAGRYSPQQHLVGPALYPYYRQALVFLVFWLVIPITLIGGALAAIAGTQPFEIWGRALGMAWNGSIYAVGLATLIFALLDREQVRITMLDGWNPTSLPDPGAGRAIPRSEPLFDLVACLTMLIWWVGLVEAPATMLESGGIRIQAAPIWGVVHVPVLVALVACIAVALMDLLSPYRSTVRTALAVVVNVGLLILLGVIYSARRFVEVSADPQFAEQAARLDYVANHAVLGALIVVTLVVVVDTLRDVWHIVRSRRGAAVAFS